MLPDINTIFNQFVREFDIKNGDDGVVIQDRPGYLVFSNGAMRDVSPTGAQYDPDPDPLERLCTQRRYHEELVRRAESEFRERKKQLLNGCRTPARWEKDRWVAVDDEAELKKVQALVFSRREKLAGVRAEIEKLNAPARQVNAETQNHKQERREEIDKIKI